MMPIIPPSQVFDQSTLERMLEHDPTVQFYDEFFALLDWRVVPDNTPDAHRPGKRPHPEAAYVKALLIKISEKLDHCTDLRTYLLRHPLLVLALGFRPVLDVSQPYGFDVERTVPSDSWLRHKQRHLKRGMLQDLLAATVQALQEEIPGLGETVAFDVKHLYAWVKQNNSRVYVKDRYSKDQQPTGDPDCRVGVKRSTNQEQPDGSTKEKKEYLWGYGTGVATSFVAGYGDVVLAEYTLPFNENDISYFFPLYLQTVAHLGHYPLNITADAAFDAWYVYQTCIYRGGIAAIALNLHGHPESRRDADGTPLCAKGLRMVSSFQFSHTRGYTSQRFLCPLLHPQASGQCCDHEQFKKGGCVKDLNWERGGQMRVTLKRDGPQYKVIYRQRTSAERINSQAKAQHIERPHVRNRRSVANLNTLTYLVINANALKRVRKTNRDLLTAKFSRAA
jgi:hypothetical protein